MQKSTCREYLAQENLAGADRIVEFCRVKIDES